MSTQYTGALVFATPMEAEPFLNKMALSQIARFPFKVYSSNNSGAPNFLVLICGMGLDAAALSVKHLVNQYRLPRVLNCGIAGSLSDAFTVGEILRVASIANVSDARTADDLAKIEFFTVPNDIVDYPGNLSSVRLVSQATPVFDVERRALLAEHADLIDMEGWAIASECQRYSVSCGLLKVVSDHAEDRETLLKNLAHTSRRLAEFVSYFIEALFHSEIDHDSQRPLTAL